MLAGVSVDYYTKMERGDLRGVSDSVLDALARGLRLDEAERTHLLDLARAAGPSSTARRRRTAPARVRPSVQRIIDAMTHAPALVQNGRGDVLAANRLGYALYSEMDLAPPAGRPTTPASSSSTRAPRPSSPEGTASPTTRRDAAHRSRPRPTRPQPQRPRRQLSTRSDAFRTRWAAHNVRAHQTGTKRYHHPVVGDLTLTYEILEPPADPGLDLLALSASPAPPPTTRSTCSEAGPPPPGTGAFRARPDGGIYSCNLGRSAVRGGAMRGRVCAVLCAATTTATLAGSAVSAQAAAPVEWDRLASGFVHETYNADGFPNGVRARRTRGALHGVPDVHERQGPAHVADRELPAARHLPQGSTMWLFEGSQRALLVDTAQNTADLPIVPGQADLVTVVKHLLGHQQRRQREGRTRSTSSSPSRHSHGDHTGKVAAMAPRTVYYPDLRLAGQRRPRTTCRSRRAAGRRRAGRGRPLDLGDRVIEAVDIPGHTAGSTGLPGPREPHARDRRRDRLGVRVGALRDVHPVPVTSDAPPAGRARAVPGHRPLPGALLPDQAVRPGEPPINGRPLDFKYVDDQAAIADGVLDGTMIGEPYRERGRNTVWTGVRLGTRRRTRSPTSTRAGSSAATARPGIYHAITIPGTYKTPLQDAARRPGDRQHQDRLLPDPRQRQHVDVPDQGLDQGAAGRHRHRDAGDRRLREAPRGRRCRWM